ncbi:TetR/AcrR family transcriptional regulator [Lentzea nigeriaca]|uniref:TetR/AcrR family transcriptional regulator n=1 Tax=Lentzea nigeriaca TaxID=1128665 RepID=UPI0019561197|nr:TetR family transcriptional regulator [Lentzea nigeriaca]MBM7863071.1 AcrR family transcriptional regulator [Lentzea nigeriaca]
MPIGRPSLTERRKAETRLDVARAAVGLFVAKGVAATSAEEIAAAAGISARTLWRYFPTKDSCVMPLLTGAIELAADCLRSWRDEDGIPELIEVMRQPGRLTIDRASMLDLVRLTRTEPGLRAVWLEAHRQAEPVFAEALARRGGLHAPDLTATVHAAMINAALRAAVEHYAFQADPDTEVEAAVSEALLIAARGFPR